MAKEDYYLRALEAIRQSELYSKELIERLASERIAYEEAGFIGFEVATENDIAKIEIIQKRQEERADTLNNLLSRT